MAQRLSALAVLQEYWSSVPSPHFERLTTTCNSSSMGSHTLFWPMWVPVHMGTHIHINLIFFFYFFLKDNWRVVHSDVKSCYEAPITKSARP